MREHVLRDGSTGPVLGIRGAAQQESGLPDAGVSLAGDRAKCPVDIAPPDDGVPDVGVEWLDTASGDVIRQDRRGGLFQPQRRAHVPAGETAGGTAVEPDTDFMAPSGSGNANTAPAPTAAASEANHGHRAVADAPARSGSSTGEWFR